METGNEIYSWDKLPFELDENRWGKLNRAVEECPGVYYVSVIPEGKRLGRELYVVTSAATPSIISPEVAALGIDVGDVRIFEYADIDSVYNLVKFEIMRYRVQHGLPAGEGNETLYSAAMYYGEYFPWYFGGTIPPRDTPFGLTVRTKKAGEGLFFLETEHCRWSLAVSFPIWNTELSEYTKGLGMICNDDLSELANESRYLFFPRERCAPAVYELLDNPDHKGLEAFIKSRQALETCLWEHFPQNALKHNALEMSGNGRADMLENLLKAFGTQLPEVDGSDERKKERRVKNCITYSKELTGQELLLLP